MTGKNGGRLMASAAMPAEKSDLGSWFGDTFRFHSPEHERDWQQRAYRQSVDPDRWQQQPPVDRHTQALLDGMPHLGSGEFFFGPDGKYRRVTMDLREDRDTVDIRRKAFNEFAQSGVTWNELAQYPDDKPHPGEAEALAARETKRATADTAAKATDAGQTSGRFGPETAKPDLTRIAADIAPDLAGESAGWGLQPKEAGSAPILVATSDKAISGLPKEVERSQPFVTPSRRTPAQRRNFNEKLAGRTANDNHRIAANDNASTTAAQNNLGRVEVQASERLTGTPTATAGEALDADADWQVTNRLFNWQRDGKSAPAPSEYAINVASDEGRFVYLEEMKDEWSRLLEQDPEKVFRSMAGEVEKLSNAAQKDFHEAYRRTATPEEVAKIDDVMAKIVFAPAEHWTNQVGTMPGEKVGAKPYIALPAPVVLNDQQLASAFGEAAQLIAQQSEAREGGRSGSGTNRKDIEYITKRLAEAIKACGGNVTAELYGSGEPQVQYIQRQVKKSRYPDIGTPFEIGGRKVSPFVTHYTPKADGVTMVPREKDQLAGLVVNLARAIWTGELGIDAVGIGQIPKRAKGQSDEEYYKAVDDLVEDMVDCKRPFLIKLDIDPLNIGEDD